ncbi:hypothetical protein [Bordetella holmesii]|nr:hypothetical protein [Bordetella holmesii]KAK81123.1 hypothetical protein L503_1112 [Bordetella holmesii CDC-H809-BH]KAK87098.1 hypothetical protein L573_1169 [Bordetella holmesii H620]KAK88097.1 hypothetical protein L496_1093 [Bordetella holmesii CDC-H572-BH]KAK90176.1 hypothetical protein L499_A1123 [Bordetella holmesii CDC-H635-BH]KCV04122.1 hypothetical protein L498_1191 [Bordetella holmesii CDC-H629-BH]KCV06408.1 hypothetical protein L501_1104 [Bordetella holmesii CDC-H719-BH]KCV1433
MRSWLAAPPHAGDTILHGAPGAATRWAGGAGFTGYSERHRGVERVG